MNSLERTQKAIRGEEIDRIPTFPILLAPACELLGVKQRDYFLNPEVMANTLIQARELINADGIYVSRDNWVYHQALGGNLYFPEDDESYSKTCLLSSVAEFRKLKVPKPETATGMKDILEAARRVVDRVGDKYYIQANIDVGPFSLAAVLRGAQNMLLDIVIEDPLLVKEFLEFCSEVVIAYGKAMIKTGVHGIQFGDATAGLIGPEMFAEFSIPYQKHVLEELANPNCDLWVHICGNSNHTLSQLSTLEFDGFEVDSKVDLAYAKKMLPGKALKGNIDTTLLLTESAGNVYKATMKMLQESGMSTGLIASPGCGVGRMTPKENLLALAQACTDYSV